MEKKKNNHCPGMLYTPLLGIYQNQTHHLALNKGLMDSGLDSMCIIIPECYMNVIMTSKSPWWGGRSDPG